MSDTLTAIIGLLIGLSPAAWLCLRAFKRGCDEAERQSGGHW